MYLNAFTRLGMIIVISIQRNMYASFGLQHSVGGKLHRKVWYVAGISELW